MFTSLCASYSELPTTNVISDMIFSAYKVAILLIIILELSKFAMASSSGVLSHLKDLCWYGPGFFIALQYITFIFFTVCLFCVFSVKSYSHDVIHLAREKLIKAEGVRAERAGRIISSSKSVWREKAANHNIGCLSKFEKYSIDNVKKRPSKCQ